MNPKEQKAIENTNLIHKIRQFVTEDKETTLEVCSDDHDFINFSTRENGNVGDEKPSEIDYFDAERIKKILIEKFEIHRISANIELVDEWVHLNIELKC